MAHRCRSPARELALSSVLNHVQSVRDIDLHRIQSIALLRAAHWVRRSASQSALMTEANAKFKRLLT
jgi:hypothetical protein